MRYLIIVLILLVSVVMVVFGVQNTQKVELTFLSYGAKDVSLALVVVLAALGGVILSGLITVWNSIQSGLRERSIRRRLERENRDLAQRLSIIERENQTLRAALQTKTGGPASAPAGESRPSTRL
ncbi:MAG: lipopolysaccharide assembly protein LapA domain-containing protein [Roseiflexaceae bacterium]|nr:lipopolysaccharide assembly protein LapA domain-containing protein [Roseiflexaceae bacterium]